MHGQLICKFPAPSIVLYALRRPVNESALIGKPKVKVRGELEASVFAKSTLKVQCHSMSYSIRLFVLYMFISPSQLSRLFPRLFDRDHTPPQLPESLSNLH